MIRLNAGASTDTGQVRSINQDRYLVAEPVFVVADGMGGHLGGEVASRMACDTIEEAAKNNKISTGNGLVSTVISANAKVFQTAQSDETVQGMGTTLTAIALVEEEEEQRFAVVNVGDSRTYLMRDGQLQQITTDHSLVEDLLRAGQITPQEAAEHPRRNMLTRALGVEPMVDPDLLQILPLKGDRYLLCSDGLVRELTDDQIAAVLRRLADPKEAARDLVARANEAGGSDNITVVIVDVTDDDDAARSAAKKNEHQPILAPGVASRPAAPKAKPLKASDATLSPEPHAPIFTFRVVLFLVALVAVIGLAAVGITSYANSSYYVAVSGENVAIFKGKPGGILWVEPSLNEVTKLRLSQVAPSRRDDIQNGHVVSGKPAARLYIANLRSESIDLRIISTTTLRKPTTTTKAK